MYELDITYARAEQAYRSDRIRDSIVGSKAGRRVRRATRRPIVADVR